MDTVTYRVLMEPPAGKVNWTETYRGDEWEGAVDAFLALVGLYARFRALLPEVQLTDDPAGQRWLMRARSVADE